MVLHLDVHRVVQVEALDDHPQVDRYDDGEVVEDRILHENEAVVHLVHRHDRDRHNSRMVVVVAAVGSRRSHPVVEAVVVHHALEVEVHTRACDRDEVRRDTFLRHNPGIFPYHVGDYRIYHGICVDHDRYDMVDSLIGTCTYGEAMENKNDYDHDDDAHVPLLPHRENHEMVIAPSHFDYYYLLEEGVMESKHDLDGRHHHRRFYPLTP